MFARRTDAGQVRRDIHARVLCDRDQRAVGAVLIGAAGAMGNGEIIRTQRSKLTDRCRKLRHALRRAQRSNSKEKLGCKSIVGSPFRVLRRPKERPPLGGDLN